ncbi:MAG: toll/interleukin-1 receptor domain-containing protein [Gammaproteobacteria bacterium]|nr:toll/interleukin-1 receptor domain-containing protein [Gammaproteobacteria bacterium]
MSKKVFISYSHSDQKQADAVCNRLESSGIKCWMAPRDISPSKDWAEEIIDAINSVDIMVLVFSSHSNTSPQVRREIERAVHKGLNVLPFRIEDVALSKSLEYFISTQHWLDASTGSFNGHLDELYNCVKALTDGQIPPCSSDVLKKTASGSPSTTKAVSFAASDLTRIVENLATHLGPMAKIIVSKKAMQSSTLKDLVHALSHELDTEQERDTFIQACLSRVMDSN